MGLCKKPQDENKNPIYLGSGFFVRENIIATNMHVVGEALSGYAKIVGNEKKYNIVGIVGVDKERDLVLLSASGIKAPTLSIEDSNELMIGDEVYAIGNPQGLEGTFSQGIVSGIRKIGSDSLLQITAPISPGSSGGPVLNAQGMVIGVAVATFKEGQNLNFAIPALYLSLLLQNIKPISPLPMEKSNLNKSVLDNLGERGNEGVVGSQFLWTLEIPYGGYSFSLRNKLRDPVRNVYCLIIFYDYNKEPIDIDEVRCLEIVPAGLAKRLTGKVDESVQELTTPEYSKKPATKIEIRVLDFQIAR